jgi:microsomal dipeptidase-like Zn-dependent dipeptidase
LPIPKKLEEVYLIMELHEQPLLLGFESGDKAHWMAEGEAFVNQPVHGDRVRASQARPTLVSLGGDYWDGPYPVGNRHQYWIHTEDHLTGTFTSREFVIDGNYPWFSFLIGGGQDIANLRVELLVKATATNAEKFASRSYPLVSIPERGDFLMVFAETGTGSEIMQRVVFNVISAQLVGERGCVRIVDTTSTNHISVDDVRFSYECPELTPLLEGGGDPSAPVWGFADLHAHPMASLAFGGVPFWGQSDGPIETALANCTPAHGIGGTGLSLSKGVGNFLMAFFEETGYHPGLLGWLYPGHRVGGFPDFDGWPKFTTIIHQQMYIDWIKRAYEGGLRLMVAHVVNNELLAHEFSRQRPKEPHDDRAAVEIQLTAMKELVARHADQMEIAYCAADARRIIRQNRLAIVLGVEVDSLGNWHRPEDCSEDEIRSYLHHLYHDLGVRHLFPIHLANNAFGGPAIYNDLFNVINRFLRDDYFQVEAGSADGVEFRLGEDPGPVVGRYQLPPKPFYAPPDYSQVPGGHVNVEGLTSHGQLLIKEMICLGMLIDIDHMSYKSVDQTLDIVEAFDYPVVSGHTHFQELAWHRQETANIHKRSSEFFKTPQHLERIRKLGGMVAPILNQQDNREVRDVISSLAGKILQHCAGSSTSWAQAYLYAVEKMKGKGVGIGTDMNGFYKSPCPRFGLNAAYYLHYNLPGMGQDSLRQTQRRDQAFAQSNGVRYATPIKDVRNYRFKGVIEGEVFDSVERDIWQAIALYFASSDSSSHQLPSGLSSRVANLVKGFRAANTGRLSRLASRERALRTRRTSQNMRWERRAAFLVKLGQSPSASDPEPVQRMYDKILPIWQLWQAMQGANIPLHRSYAGHRDFDINIDGVAHYGMLPDFIQDMKNVGLTDEDLLPLFRSAEEYIRVWEKCECRRAVLAI